MHSPGKRDAFEKLLKSKKIFDYIPRQLFMSDRPVAAIECHAFSWSVIVYDTHPLSYY
ncbi:hypothetical protein EMIT0357P_10235 [Pseudomonas marginalis]